MDIVKEELYKSSNVYEMFGVDIVMDEKFNMYIIEINASPMVVGTTEKKFKMMHDMMNGLFSITYA